LSNKEARREKRAESLCVQRGGSALADRRKRARETRDAEKKKKVQCWTLNGGGKKPGFPVLQGEG